MLKILQASLQHYMNYVLPDVQASFRKGRGTRDQIATVHWIIEKASEFQKKKIYFCIIAYAKALTVWITTNCGITLSSGNTTSCYLLECSEILILKRYLYYHVHSSKTWKQLKCLLMSDCMKKICFMYAVEDFSAMRKNFCHLKPHRWIWRALC